MRTGVLLAVLTAFSLALQQGLSNRNRPKLPPHSPTLDAALRIDAAFEDLWRRKNLTPAPLTDDFTVARRLSLALTGTIPSLQDLRWLEQQPDGERLPRWTDRLLADPRCHDYLAERLARAMNSLAPAEPFFMYRRRRFVAWLSERISKRTPYDEIVRECIATDGVWTEKPAVNFLTGHDVNPNKLANRTARAFLGVRIDCAECHDHPFAAWKQADFRGLAAWYGNAELTWRGIVDTDGPALVEHPVSRQKEAVEPRAPFQKELLPAEGSPRSRLAAWVTHRDNKFFAKAAVNRMWQLLYGRGIVEPVDNLDGDPAAPEVLDLLARDFVEHNGDLHRLIRIMASLRAFRLQSAFETEATEADESAFAAFPISRLRPEQAAASLVQVSRLFTIDDRSSTLLQLTAFGSQSDFIERYGDAGEEETTPQEGNIAQRLLMLNGEVVHQEIKADLATSARHLADLARDDEQLLDLAFRMTIGRTPSREERADMKALLATSQTREQAVEDILWALVNSTEFSWTR
jgi:hypothetical protein